MSKVKIQLTNVRISYPSLFKRSVYKGKEGKYEATFLIPKTNAKIKKKIDKIIADTLAEAKVKKVSSDNNCFKDGDCAETSKGEPYDGYKGHWTLKAKNNNSPVVINRDKSTIIQGDRKIYSGCYVNAIVDIWISNADYGKRFVCANLHGVQFFEDGEPLGSGNIDIDDVIDDFDDLDDDIEDDEDDDL